MNNIRLIRVNGEVKNKKCQSKVTTNKNDVGYLGSINCSTLRSKYQQKEDIWEKTSFNQLRKCEHI